MLIEREKCTRCARCSRYCPVGAIFLNRSKKYFEVDLDKCVECYNCMRQSKCDTDALRPQQLIWPRTIRNVLSDELAVAAESGISGRGTEEMKTNEVTGRFKEGEIGVAVEMGRPLVGTNVLDIEKVAMKLAALDVEFEKDNPVTSFIEDLDTGRFKEELLHERCLSAIIEIRTGIEKLPEILAVLEEVQGELNTVFSLCLASKLDEQGQNPTLETLDRLGIKYHPNGKTNIGLGRPQFNFAGHK